MSEGVRHSGPNDGRPESSRRCALVLGGAVLSAVLALGGIERLAAERVDAARAGRLAATVAEVLPGVAFDNDPVQDRRRFVDPTTDSDQPRAVYRARLDGRPVGMAMRVIAPDGYSGPIELLVGVDASGRIAAVRVAEHRETPGLGDRIERRRSAWITTFEGRRIDGDVPGDWQVRRRRGAASDARLPDERDATRFDALSGATITSRAVVDATQGALRWFAEHRDEGFAP